MDTGFSRTHNFPIRYKGVYPECGYRIDMLVENRIVSELEAVEKLTLLHEAQLLSYLKSGSWDTGIMNNFNVPVLKQGIKRKVLNLNQH
jgi:GxxExxY protein